MKILNGVILILDDQGNHLESYTISLESFRSFRGPLFCKPVTSQELFFAVSYRKPALEIGALRGDCMAFTVDQIKFVLGPGHLISGYILRVKKCVRAF